jgi:hypothetical protein
VCASGASIDGLIALLFLCVHPEQGQLPSFDWQMRMSSSTGAKNALFEPLVLYNNDHFTKTGSGQT